MQRIGIIGMGYMGRIHLAALRKLTNAEVAAVATSRSLSDLDGVRVYDAADTLLADPALDAVVIALPTPLHKDAILKAFSAGKHVICEKPLALSSAEGREVLAATRQTDRRLCVAHCIRFWPAYAKAKTLIAEGRLGKPLRADLFRLSPAPDWSANNWLADAQQTGGCRLDLQIHDIDYAQYVFGKPDRVHGYASERGGLSDVLSVLEYDNGPLVSISACWDAHTSFRFRMGFRIVLEGATLVYDSGGDGKLHIHGDDGTESLADLSDDDGYVLQDAYFIDCLEQGRAPEIVTPESSVEAIVLVEALERSVVK